jgi:hypothetical protein
MKASLFLKAAGLSAFYGLVAVGDASAAELGIPVDTVPVVSAVTVKEVPRSPEPYIDPVKLYGGAVTFDVFRKGDKVGEHHLTFVRDARGDLNVKADFHLAITVLFIKAYTFEYSAHEIWRGKQLVALAAVSDDDGKVTKTSARLEDGVFKITGPKGNILTSSWIYPTNHWNRGQADSAVVLNTLTGAVASVKIENRGRERVETGQGTVEADHFVYTGDLHDVDSWYDSAGRWVKMRFKAKDGSYIDYICRQCGTRAAED